MSSKSPGPCTTLLAVTGLSPAILTETVWALAKEPTPIIPHDIVVITTTQGAEDIKKQLLTPRQDWGGTAPWTALREYILGSDAASDPRLQLTTPRVIELPDPSGIKTAAKDLRTKADNDAAADFILEQVRAIVENPDTRLVASIAGGRKTMGALLYACMSLLGRDTDRLTHVLVTEPFEQCRDFFFPGQPHKNILGPGGTKLDARKARIELADVPFVTLRNLFERDFARRPGTFARLVEEACKNLPKAPPKRVEVHTAEPIVTIDGTHVRLSTKQHVLMLLLAKNCREGKPMYPDHTQAHQDYKSFVEELKKQNSYSWNDWRRSLSSCNSVAQDDLRKIVSQIRKKLTDAGDNGRRLEHALQSRRFLGIALNAKNIRIV